MDILNRGEAIQERAANCLNQYLSTKFLKKQIENLSATFIKGT